MSRHNLPNFNLSWAIQQRFWNTALESSAHLDHFYCLPHFNWFVSFHSQVKNLTFAQCKVVKRSSELLAIWSDIWWVFRGIFIFGLYSHLLQKTFNIFPKNLQNFLKKSFTFHFPLKNHQIYNSITFPLCRKSTSDPRLPSQKTGKRKPS